MNTADTNHKERKNHKWVKSMLWFFVKVCVTVLAVCAALTWVIGIYMCHDNAAYPMIKDGDFCLTYRLCEIQQGDAVVYSADGENRIGRVIALSGNEVSILNERILIDGYEYFDNTVYATTAEGAGLELPHKISENCVFVLNDYRSDIHDSRTFGDIPLDSLQGKIVFIMRRRGI